MTLPGLANAIAPIGKLDTEKQASCAYRIYYLRLNSPELGAVATGMLGSYTPCEVVAIMEKLPTERARLKSERPAASD